MGETGKIKLKDRTPCKWNSSTKILYIRFPRISRVLISLSFVPRRHVSMTLQNHTLNGETPRSMCFFYQYNASMWLELYFKKIRRVTTINGKLNGSSIPTLQSQSSWTETLFKDLLSNTQTRSHATPLSIAEEKNTSARVLFYFKKKT